MFFEGTVSINAPQEKVYAFLTDPERVSQCAPGLESLKIIIPDKQFNVVASLGFGSVKATFNVDVEWEDLQPPSYARMKAHGKAPGSGADVTSDMRLSSNAENTVTDLKWTADVVIVGTIASMASRLLGGMTKKLSGAFFDCVKSKIETMKEVNAPSSAT
jgi:uncharacterized protein